jgi:hypothetical protein
MVRLSKKAREELAALINAHHVAEIMKRDFQEKIRELQKKDSFDPEGEEYERAVESVSRWQENGFRTEIELADKYGIELPGLKWARDLIRDR